MSQSSDHTLMSRERSAEIEAMLCNAACDRLVAPPDQPFAFVTHPGKVRKDNQDTALVLVARPSANQTVTVAVLCDGIGGLSNGDQAADLAAATAAAVLASEPNLDPLKRMERALHQANCAVFDRFRGSAGAVIVAAVVQGNDTIIGWAGDARAYGLDVQRRPKRLTTDDTVAAELERLGRVAPNPMLDLTRNIGQHQDVEPHVLRLDAAYSYLLLASDGVHRMDSSAFEWICRHARTPKELVERLRAAANWEGGVDNATALAIEFGKEARIDCPAPTMYAWVEAQPRVWQVVTASDLLGKPALTTVQPKSPVSLDAQFANDAKPKKERRKKQQRADLTSMHHKDMGVRMEQAPLIIEFGQPEKDKQ